MTDLCVAIFVHSVEQALRDIASAAEAGADLAELRLDHVADRAVVDQLANRSILPCILTCRPPEEGGQSPLSDAQRIDLLAAGKLGRTRYADLELATYRRHSEVALQCLGPSIILSAHDFAGRPDRLYNLLAEMNQSPAAVSKIVWMARTIRDNLEAFEVLLHRTKPTIALCMGEAGVISRILARKFGGFLTYASLPGDSGTAPGQVSITDLKRLYRWDKIGPETRVYGVVAKPVAHSMSPAVHNAAFDAIDYDGVYLPLLVEPTYESFKAFMESFLAFAPLHLSGLSITIPHKENALRYLEEKGAQVEPLARSIGAVNTIVVGSRIADRQSQISDLKPEIRGFNTDYAAILDCITTALSISREQLAGLRIAVIGAGGTGRTAVAALAHYGATVVVYNRTRQRADALAARFNGKSGKVVAAPLEKLCDSCCQVYINTTSVGMHPNVNDWPLGDTPPKFSADTLVFDTIYNPMKTRLLTEAEAAGARTIGGVEMFVRQAVAQFEAWTGRPAPVDVMRRVIEQRLAAR